MTLLVDAVHCIISSDEEGTIESRSLNTELADYLKELNTMIIVVTNAGGDHYTKIRAFLNDYNFSTFTLEKNPPKTSSKYFAHLITYYGLDPQQCVYLDHSHHNLTAALALQIKGELFVNNTQAIEFLKIL